MYYFFQGQNLSVHVYLVTRLIRRMPLVEQELLSLPEHLNSPPVLMGFVLLDLQVYVYVLQNVVYPFVLLLLIIVLSVLYRYTDSDYRFGIIKLSLYINLHRLIVTPILKVYLMGLSVIMHMYIEPMTTAYHKSLYSSIVIHK